MKLFEITEQRVDEKLGGMGKAIVGVMMAVMSSGAVADELDDNMKALAGKLGITSYEKVVEVYPNRMNRAMALTRLYKEKFPDEAAAAEEKAEQQIDPFAEIKCKTGQVSSCDWLKKQQR